MFVDMVERVAQNLVVRNLDPLPKCIAIPFKPVFGTSQAVLATHRIVGTRLGLPQSARHPLLFMRRAPRGTLGGNNKSIFTSFAGSLFLRMVGPAPSGWVAVGLPKVAFICFMLTRSLVCWSGLNVQLMNSR